MPDIKKIIPNEDMWPAATKTWKNGEEKGMKYYKEYMSYADAFNKALTEQEKAPIKIASSEQLEVPNIQKEANKAE